MIKSSFKSVKSIEHVLCPQMRPPMFCTCQVRSRNCSPVPGSRGFVPTLCYVLHAQRPCANHFRLITPGCTEESSNRRTPRAVARSDREAAGAGAVVAVAGDALTHSPVRSSQTLPAGGRPRGFLCRTGVERSGEVGERAGAAVGADVGAAAGAASGAVAGVGVVAGEAAGVVPPPPPVCRCF